jgi:hypothetical protein
MILGLMTSRRRKSGLPGPMVTGHHGAATAGYGGIGGLLDRGARQGWMLSPFLARFADHDGSAWASPCRTYGNGANRRRRLGNRNHYVLLRPGCYPTSPGRTEGRFSRWVVRDAEGVGYLWLPACGAQKMTALRLADIGATEQAGHIGHRDAGRHRAAGRSLLVLSGRVDDRWHDRHCDEQRLREPHQRPAAPISERRIVPDSCDRDADR